MNMRFGVIGINHDHINGMTDVLLAAGAELVAFFAPEDDLAATFASRYSAPRAATPTEILEDESIQLIATAGIADERGPLGIEAMRHGKDFLSDKPGFTELETLEEARRVQRSTGRLYIIDYSERTRNRAMIKASELVASGAIGQVLQTIGTGPHRLNIDRRPDWFFERKRYGGILTDIGSHQADHFLHFTRSTSFEIAASQVGNLAHPDKPELEDFGDVLVRGDGGSGYFRVDWFTPDGLDSWGDGRLTILGTDGFIEVRKNIDIAGRPGAGHVFLVDQRSTQYVDCSKVEVPFGRQLVADVRDRTQSAMPQAHSFLAAELALRAQQSSASLSREEFSPPSNGEGALA